MTLHQSAHFKPKTSMVGAADMLGYQSSNGGGLGDMGLVRTTSTRGHYLQYVATCVGQGGVGGVPTALTSPWGGVGCLGWCLPDVEHPLSSCGSTYTRVQPAPGRLHQPSPTGIPTAPLTSQQPRTILKRPLGKQASLAGSNGDGSW